jgi:hypothetical protein
MSRRGERGQATIGFGITGSLLLLMTIGLVDAGRAFYQYNAVAALARAGSRWAAVVGGECRYADSVSDWCNQLGSSTAGFWSQSGNVPLQTGGAPCPSTYDPVGYPGYYYRVADYAGTSATTIVGELAHQFMSDSRTPSFIHGALSAGFVLSSLEVCIQLPDSWDSEKAAYIVNQRDPVGVFVYALFYAVGPFFTRGQIKLYASSNDEIQGNR